MSKAASSTQNNNNDKLSAKSLFGNIRPSITKKFAKSINGTTSNQLGKHAFMRNSNKHLQNNEVVFSEFDNNNTLSGSTPPSITRTVSKSINRTSNPLGKHDFMRNSTNQNENMVSFNEHANMMSNAPAEAAAADTGAVSNLAIRISRIPSVLSASSASSADTGAVNNLATRLSGIPHVSSAMAERKSWMLPPGKGLSNANRARAARIAQVASVRLEAASKERAAAHAFGEAAAASASRKANKKTPGGRYTTRRKHMRKLSSGKQTYKQRKQRKHPKRNTRKR